MRTRRCTPPSRQERTRCGFTARSPPRMIQNCELAPQIPVSVLDVAPQLLALLRRHLPLLRRWSLAAGLVLIDVAHVLAHALALVLAHALVLAGETTPRLSVAAALRKGGRRGNGQREKERDELHRL